MEEILKRDLIKLPHPTRSIISKDNMKYCLSDRTLGNFTDDCHALKLLLVEFYPNDDKIYDKIIGYKFYAFPS